MLEESQWENQREMDTQTEKTLLAPTVAAAQAADTFARCAEGPGDGGWSVCVSPGVFRARFNVICKMIVLSSATVRHHD
eukprot:SAG31_NODE_4676_length_3040_cov_8.089425_2_plen_79_part_00